MVQVLQAGSKVKTQRMELVLARQSKKEKWEFGVTIKAETHEQRQAAADWPRKVIVLWPLQDHEDTKTAWGMCEKHSSNIQWDPSHQDVQQFLSDKSAMERLLHEKSLRWCRDYLKVPPLPLSDADNVTNSTVHSCCSF